MPEVDSVRECHFLYADGCKGSKISRNQERSLQSLERNVRSISSELSSEMLMKLD